MSVTEAGKQKFSNLFVSELEEPLRTNFEMSEPQKHYAKCKEPDTESHMSCDYVRMKYSEQVNPYRRKADR